MKKQVAIVMSMILSIFCFIGCSVDTSSKPSLSEKYSIGKEIELGDIKFNIYKIDDKNKEIYLLAKESIADTAFSDEEHQGSYVHSYKGSLIEGYIDSFVEELEGKGVEIISSGLIR